MKQMGRPRKNEINYQKKIVITSKKLLHLITAELDSDHKLFFNEIVNQRLLESYKSKPIKTDKL